MIQRECWYHQNWKCSPNLDFCINASYRVTELQQPCGEIYSLLEVYFIVFFVCIRMKNLTSKVFPTMIRNPLNIKHI